MGIVPLTRLKSCLAAVRGIKYADGKIAGARPHDSRTPPPCSARCRYCSQPFRPVPRPGGIATEETEQTNSWGRLHAFLLPHLGKTSSGERPFETGLNGAGVKTLAYTSLRMWGGA